MALSIGAEARSAKTSQLQTSFQNLADAATTLNKESDKFSGAISTLDEALNRLSPGVSTWVLVSRWAEEEEPWSSNEERLGFAKTNNRWGLSLSRVAVDLNSRQEETKDVWLFNDAPRNLRLHAIDHIPDLVAALALEAKRVALEVTAGAEIAMEMLQSVNAAVAAKEKRR
jgi:hypothetical protein